MDSSIVSKSLEVSDHFLENSVFGFLKNAFSDELSNFSWIETLGDSPEILIHMDMRQESKSSIVGWGFRGKQLNKSRKNNDAISYEKWKDASDTYSTHKRDPNRY